MAEKISSRVYSFDDISAERNLRILLIAAQADIAALRASIVGINAKLDADAGVTDTNFGASWNPVALQFIQ